MGHHEPPIDFAWSTHSNMYIYIYIFYTYFVKQQLHTHYFVSTCMFDGGGERAGKAFYRSMFGRWECKRNQTYILGPGPGPFLMFNLVGPPTCLRVGSYSLWLTFFCLLEWILLFYSCCPNFIHWLFLSWANPQSGHSQSTQHHASPCLHQVPESI